MDDLKHNTSIEQQDQSPGRGSGRSLRPDAIPEEDDLDMDGNAIKNSKLSGERGSIMSNAGLKSD